MQIGEPIRTFIVEPLPEFLPAPLRDEPAQEPVTVPAEPEKEPVHNGLFSR